MKCFWGPVSAPCAQDDKFSPCMNCPNPRSECPVPQNAQLSLLPEAAGRPLAAPPLASPWPALLSPVPTLDPATLGTDRGTLKPTLSSCPDLRIGQAPSPWQTLEG